MRRTGAGIVALCGAVACAPRVSNTIGTANCERTTSSDLVAGGLKAQVRARKLDEGRLRERFPGSNPSVAPDGDAGDPWLFRIEVEGVPKGHTVEVLRPHLMEGCSELSFELKTFTPEQLRTAQPAAYTVKREPPPVHAIMAPPETLNGSFDWSKLSWLENPITLARPTTPKEKRMFREAQERKHALTRMRHEGIKADNERLAGKAANEGSMQEAFVQTMTWRCDGGVEPSDLGFVARAAGSCEWVAWTNARSASAVDGSCKTPDAWQLFGEVQLVEDARACAVSGRRDLALSRESPRWHIGERDAGKSWLTLATEVDDPAPSVSFCGRSWAPDTRLLVCHDSAVTEVEPLLQLPKLMGVDLSQSGVRDVSALAKLAELAFIDLSQTSVSDVRPLAGMKQLLHLNLQKTKVPDSMVLQPLLATIDTLDLCNTPAHHVDDLGFSTVELFTHLPFCKVPWQDTCEISCGEAPSPWPSGP